MTLFVISTVFRETNLTSQWFKFSDGDKDIFRFAMLALRKRWGVPGRWVSPAGFPRRTMSGDFCGHTMLQHDAYGEPMFIHYNLLKQIPSGVRKGFSWGRMKRFPMFDDYPASPATARLGGRSVDDGMGGGGDVDCDMLADADEEGVGRSKAPEVVMRRAARERGVKVVYHGGVTSALWYVIINPLLRKAACLTISIDLQYVDPRPKSRQDEDQSFFAAEDAKRNQREQAWQSKVDEARSAGLPEPIRPDDLHTGPTDPDWRQSPIEVSQS
jgi:alpha 1,2-mannosyltransferase